MIGKSPLLKKIVDGISNYKPKKLDIYGLIASAVLVPIIDESLIFIKRTMTVKDHKGQIAFPGGVMEEGESPEETALREAQEEIGINPKSTKIIGFLDDTVTVAGYLIHPVVALIDQDDFNPKINEKEVEELIILPIKKIIASEYIEGGRLRWEFHIGNVIVWGATARILKNFLEISGLKKFEDSSANKIL